MGKLISNLGSFPYQTSAMDSIILKADAPSRQQHVWKSVSACKLCEHKGLWKVNRFISRMSLCSADLKRSGERAADNASVKKNEKKSGFF